jgi:hypothetical protein
MGEERGQGDELTRGSRSHDELCGAPCSSYRGVHIDRARTRIAESPSMKLSCSFADETIAANKAIGSSGEDLHEYETCVVLAPIRFSAKPRHDLVKIGVLAVISVGPSHHPSKGRVREGFDRHQEAL